MRNDENKFIGNIVSVRKIEDCIRATKSYTEGVHTMLAKHPIQGTEFPSKKFCKYYEVYPGTELSWDMPTGEALKWFTGNVPLTEVTFSYDYRTNRAEVTVGRSPRDLQDMRRLVPGFGPSLDDLIKAREAETQMTRTKLEVAVEGNS